MIDLAGLATLFFETSKEWREPNVVRIVSFPRKFVFQEVGYNLD
jgi:hypothetical protein